MPKDSALTGPADTSGPWHIKAVATETRETVVRAAHRENLTVGQWLERRVREWLDAGSPVQVQEPARDHRAELATVERVVTVAAALAASPEVPRRIRARANRLLREALPGAPRRSRSAPRLAAPSAIPSSQEGSPQ